MAWDDSKSSGDTLSSSEWNTHVTDQKGHASRHNEGGADAITFVPVYLTDVSGSRAVNTTYQNTSGKIRRIKASVRLGATGGWMQWLSDASTPPTTVRSAIYSTTTGETVELVYEIPVDHYYRATTTSGCTVAFWLED